MKICKECVTRKRCALAALSAGNTAISNAARERKISKDEVLQQQGSLSRAMMVLKVGQVTCNRIGIDGRDRPLGLLSQGISFGKLSLLGLANTFTFVSNDWGRVCEIPIDVLRRHLPSHLDAVRLLALEQVRTAELIADWAQVMQFHNVQAKVASTFLLLAKLQGNPTIKIPTQASLSHILGIRRESIQRAMKDMELNAEIMHVGRSTYVIDRSVLIAHLQS
ncbi:MAG: Crp/Fnr family transcriptional regulator [Burkholderiaceae bacterium]|nr:Crp/Fnr family transcriptional regulator [Burkholderiaceae bacterium]